MDVGFLSGQLSATFSQLHTLFEEIGLSPREKEARESQLCDALSDTLHSRVRFVADEKDDLIKEANKLVKTIKQMQASLDDSTLGYSACDIENDITVFCPLRDCLLELRKKFSVVGQAHGERAAQVKKLVQALESYASHFEPSFLEIKLPPSSANDPIPPSFDLSTSFIAALDSEFTRVYEEYSKRVSTVRSISEEIIKLWAELGTPQTQIDSAIIENSRDTPEQLGLHQSDINELFRRRDRLSLEKAEREKRLANLKDAVNSLWLKLGIDEGERKAFLSSHRGCSTRTINEFQSELSRLNELKKQNLHLFVEEARLKLQDLWDALYFSEEEMLEFTAAFQDIYTDALLHEHETEIQRLEALQEQRCPILNLIDRHRSLVGDRDRLNASSQDASRLMARGVKGERRDPTRLLREEKMRKRIAKELPKVEVELNKVLDSWEDEYGRPFLVHGCRYLDGLSTSSKPKSQPRAKTPSGMRPVSSNKSISKSTSKTGNILGYSVIHGGLANSRVKTPSKLMPSSQKEEPQVTTVSTFGQSPSKIPARVPLTTSTYNNRSPESKSLVKCKMNMATAPPPKMKTLMPPPPPPARRLHQNDSIIHPVELVDVYDEHCEDRTVQAVPHQISDYASSVQRDNLSSFSLGTDPKLTSSLCPESRQISHSSILFSDVVSGSDNWETYEDGSDAEFEKDARVTHPSCVTTALKRETPDSGYMSHEGLTKRARAVGLPGYEPVGQNLRLLGSNEWVDDEVD